MFLLRSISSGIVAQKYKIMFLGIVRIIIQQCHVKKNNNELKVRKEDIDQKKSSLPQLRTPHQSKGHTDQTTNYYKNYFINMLQAQGPLTFKWLQVFEK